MSPLRVRMIEDMIFKWTRGEPHEVLIVDYH
jgi:hypothetical protein